MRSIIRPHSVGGAIRRIFTTTKSFVPNRKVYTNIIKMNSIVNKGSEKCNSYGVGCSTGFKDINGDEIKYFDKVFFRERGFISRVGVVKYFFDECCIVVENDYGLVCAPILEKQLNTVEIIK